MLKNKLGILSIILALLLSLTACGTGTDTAAADAGPQAQPDSGSEQSGQGSGNWRGNGENGEQFQRADLMGEVEAISGNKITLKLMEMPSFNRRDTSGPSAGSPSGDSSQPPAQSGENSRSENDSSGSSSGNSANSSGDNNRITRNGRDRVGRANGGGAGNGNSEGRPGGQFQMPAAEYTGESKTLTVPEDVTISSMGGRNGNNGQDTLSLSDIQQGEIVQIYYSDKEKETISKITVMQAFGGQRTLQDQSSQESDTGKTS